MTSIPVIDFGKCSITKEAISRDDYEEVGGQLYDAFANIGFAYLKNTGVNRQDVERLNEVTATFFQRPFLEKVRYLRDNDLNFGYVGIEQERADPSRAGDYKEAFDMSGDAACANDANWPDDLVPEFSQTANTFKNLCKQLALRVLETLSYGMKLKEGHFLTSTHKCINATGNVTALRCLFYPALPKDWIVKEGQLRIGEHSDYGTITLLFQDDVGGLQVQTTQGHFIDAVPIDDTVVVNVGDMLQFMTCGELKSTRHRVLLPRNDREMTTRRSIAFFVHADRKEIVNKPLVYQVGVKKKQNHDPEAKPITAYEHVRMRWDNSY